MVTNAFYWLSEESPPLGSATAEFAGLAGVR